MKTNILISFLITLLLGCNDTGNQNTTIASDATNNAASSSSAFPLNVPPSSDASLNEFYSSYKTSLNDLLAAVRKNDEAAIKTAYDKYDVDFDRIGAMREKALALGADEENKYFTFIEQTQPFMTEIHASPSVIILDEAQKEKQQ
jgi:hypothetical protein